MLLNLRIQDFAIVDQIEVEFSGGMTVLTGETGAGKSILVDALGLVLGERGGSGLVRKGAKRAEFSAQFDISKLAAPKSWLEENALDSDGDCLLRRVVNADGRSRAFVNGNAVTLQNLKLLGEMLLDIHGQHFHQSLGKSATQRDLLDHFSAAQHQRALTAAAFLEWRALANQLHELMSADADRASRLDLLRFQCEEFDALDLQASELATLETERSRHLHSGRLAEGIARACRSIFEDENANAQSLVSEASATLDGLSQLDPALEPAAALLREADIQISEAADLLGRYGDELEMDPAEQDRVEARLDAIHSLARKHRVDAPDLPDLHARLSRQLYEVQNAEELGEQLAEKVAAAEAEYREAAGELSALRRSGSAPFSQSVTSAMSDLGMAGGSFEIAIRERPFDKAAAHGLDDIEYLISANPGQPPMALSKVASGGELSRMSLAIQVIASDGSQIPTMIFDEVDSGVGGGIAEMVGKRLRDLGEARQVLCVTHLPQVASLASHHFRIMKVSDGTSTRTGISELQHAERIDELARMLGGVEITERTRDHAAEMLQSGSQYQGDTPAASRA